MPGGVVLRVHDAQSSSPVLHLLAYDGPQPSHIGNAATMPVMSVPGATGHQAGVMRDVSLATAALGCAAVTSTLLPALAIPVALAGAAGFISFVGNGLRTAQRDPVRALDRSRRQSTRGSREASDTETSDEEVATPPWRPLPTMPSFSRRNGVIQLAAHVITLFSDTHGPRPGHIELARRHRSGDPTSLARAAGRLDARDGMRRLDEHIARNELGRAIEAQLTTLDERVYGRARRDARKLERAKLRLLRARMLPPSDQRRHAIAEARSRIEDLNSPHPMIAAARSDNVAEAMRLNLEAVDGATEARPAVSSAAQSGGMAAHVPLLAIAAIGGVQAPSGTKPLLLTLAGGVMAGGCLLMNRMTAHPDDVDSGGATLDSLPDIEVLEREESIIVALPDGSWASQWDLNHPSRPMEPPPQRRRRSPGNDGTPRVVAGQSGGRDRSRPGDEVVSRHAMELAMLEHFALLPAFVWLRGLTPVEQRLWLSQHILLEHYESEISRHQPGARELLGNALERVGWKGVWDDVRVTVTGSRIDGQLWIGDSLPLLEYCLYRSHNDGVLLLSRHDVPLTDVEDQRIHALLASADCKALAGTIAPRPTVGTRHLEMMQARFRLAAIRAKATGALGSGSGSHLRGAEIVLGFINGDPYIEHATLMFSGLASAGVALPAGVAAVDFQVPNYLVLRSNAQDPDEQRRGQVVLCRLDLGGTATSADEQPFQQFIGERAATRELGASRAFIQDVIAAAPEALRPVLKRLYFDDQWLGRPSGWRQEDHVQLRPETDIQPSSCFTQWARDSALQAAAQAAETAHIQQAQQVRQWSPLGVRVQQVMQAFTSAHAVLMQWEDHARPRITAAVNAIHARLLAAEDNPGTLIGPEDRVELRYRSRTGDLAYWATQGWQAHGPSQGASNRFPDDTVLQRLRVTLYRKEADGQLRVDEERTQWMNERVFVANLCYALRDFSSSPRLLDEYKGYLARFARMPEGKQLRDTMADSIRWRIRALVDPAEPAIAALDADTRSALLDAHAHLDDAHSTLKTVSLAGHEVVGLWALHARERHFILVLGGPQGDRLMDESQFQYFLANDRMRAEQFIQQRAAFREHAGLAEAFQKTRTADGLSLSFRPTRPSSASLLWLRKLADNADFLRQPSVQLADWITMAAGLGLGVVCVAATGGLGAAVCAGGSAAFVIKGFRDGAEALERGELSSALGEMLGAGASGFGMLAPAKVARILFQVNRRVVATAAEASEALIEWAAQAAAFDKAGLLVASVGLLPGVKPMLVRRALDGAMEYVQDGRSFVRVANGNLAETRIDEHGTRRLVDPIHPAGSGAPIEYRSGAWRRREAPPHGWYLRTTPPPVVGAPISGLLPDFDLLAARDQERLTALFGLGVPQTTVTPDLRRKTSDMLVTERIRQMIENPDGVGDVLTDMPAVLNAWCFSRLGNQQGIRLYRSGGRYTQRRNGMLFGPDTVGLSVPLRRGSELPSLDQVVDAAGLEVIAVRLGLETNAPRARVMEAVKVELAGTLALHPDHHATSWRGWIDRQTILDPLPDNLYQHYPALTKEEATWLVQRSPVMANAARRWEFTNEHERIVGDLLAVRRQRRIREVLLEGRVRTLDQLEALRSHLSSLLPGRTWRIQNARGGAMELHFSLPGTTYAAERMDVLPDGRLLRPGGSGSGGIECESWQQCIHMQLDTAERDHIPSAELLLRRIRERMSVTALTPACGMRPPLTPHRIARGVHTAVAQDRAALAPCPRVVAAVSPTAADIAASIAVHAQHRTNTEAMWSTYDAVKATLSARTRNGFPQMNLASWQVTDLHFDGRPVNLGTFPTHGKALSGNIQLEGMVQGPSPRTVLFPAADGQDVRQGIYPEVYVLGADAIMADRMGSTPKLVFEEADFQVVAGRHKGRSLKSLSDKELDSLQNAHVRKRVGDLMKRDRLLRENVQELQPGIEYKAYTIRSCSEGKFIEGLLGAMRAEVSGVDAAFRSAPRTPLPLVTGRITLFTDKDPCGESCARRLKELRLLLPNVVIRVQSSFIDGTARDAARRTWVDRRKEDMTEQWKQDGKPEDTLESWVTQEWYRHQHDGEPRTWNPLAPDDDAPLGREGRL